MLLGECVSVTGAPPKVIPALYYVDCGPFARTLLGIPPSSVQSCYHHSLPHPRCRLHAPELVAMQLDTERVTLF